jgi:hypothetical protein
LMFSEGMILGWFFIPCASWGTGQNPLTYPTRCLNVGSTGGGNDPHTPTP